MTRRFARWPFLVVTVLITALACQPDSGPDRLFLDDFETLCEGVPCGWEQTTGDSGQARWVETIHPGEHGLALSDDVAVRRTDIEVSMLSLSATTLQVRVAVRCDAGSRLEMDVVAVEASGSRQESSVSFEGVPQHWDRLFEVPISFGAPLTSPRIEAVVLRKTGAGTCEIGELLIDVTRQDDVSC